MKTTLQQPKVLDGHIDPSLSNTIFAHYESPDLFMQDIMQWQNVFPDGMVPIYLAKAEQAYKSSSVDNSYDTLYKSVAEEVKSKLHTRGFTSKLLYGEVGFTTTDTGCMSKQRAMLGRRDCYFKDSSLSDDKLFHDLFINLSYDASIQDSTIRANAYALYAISQALSRLVPIRIFVVNHVQLNQNFCYSYPVKKFRQPINPEQFLFFTSESKRTLGFAAYDILNNGYRNYPTVGKPTNTVSIADFNLDQTITSIVDSLVSKFPTKFKGVLK